MKTWTVRGTLHLICKDDLRLFVSATQNEWFSRWGNYLHKYLEPDERIQCQREVLECLYSGIGTRADLISHFAEKGWTQEKLRVTLSSWGGILKDLAYQGKVLYAGPDDNSFIISNGK